MDYTEKDFGKILKGNALKMRRLMLKSGTTCMRVYDRNLERFPVTVDIYGTYARITDYSIDGLPEEDERICCDIVSRMLYVQRDRVVFHHRPKRVGKEQHSLVDETSLEIQVTENNLLFTVDLTKRIDTGLFLDHMYTRQMVGEMSMGMRVLNLFSYTGSFSVYAARGGAVLVESVDLSSTYTQWAQKNLADNGYTEKIFPCFATDAWEYVLEAIKQKRVYDIIIFDPPSFSNSRKMNHDFDVQRDYLKWIAVLNSLLAKDGKLVFSTNLGTFRLEEKAIRGYEIQEITKQVAAEGFTRRLGTARTWLLIKQQDVRIAREYLQSGRKKAVVEQHEEELAQLCSKKEESMSEENKTEENEVIEVIEVQEVQEVLETLDEQELTVQEEVATDELENDEDLVTAEPNQVEDDLLTLRWEEEDFAPLVKDQEKSQEPKREKDSYDRSERPRSGERDANQVFSERRPSSRDREDRKERPSYRDRDDRGGRPSYRDRDDRGGRPSFRDRDDRGGRPSFRDRDDRGGRPSFRDRDDRGGRPSFRDRDDRSERPSFRDRDDRSERPSFRDRDDRGGRPSFRDRDDRGGRPSFRDRDDRSERPSFRDRDDRSERPSFRDRDDRGGRPSFRDRDDRGGRPSFRDRDDRSERPSFRDRDDRGGRPSFRDRDDRSERRSFRDRDDRGGRPSFRDRDDRGGRPSFRDRDDRGGRPSFRDRDDRGGRPPFVSREERKPFSDREDSRNSERRPRRSAPKPYGFDSFRQTRTRGENEQDFFWLDKENKKGDE